MHTYFIHSPKLEAVKIGKSAQPTQRLKSFGTANPDTLVILGIIEGDREGEFHERFSEYRLDPKREWFSMGPALMDFLKAEFHCVLRQKKRSSKKNKVRAEDWPSIVHRAEKLFGCGLRCGEWDEFEEVMRDEMLDRVMPELEKGWKEEGVEPPDGWLSINEKFEEHVDATEYGDRIVGQLESWWPWVEGWNVKEDGGWLDVYLLFKKPSNQRMVEDLLTRLVVWGAYFEYGYTDFIRIKVAFCWRSRHGDEWAGEIQVLPVLDDGPKILCSGRPQLAIIAMDELAGFRLLGDKWYQRNGLPIPAEAIEMASVDFRPQMKYVYPYEDKSDVDAGRRDLAEVPNPGDTGEDLGLGDHRPIDGGVS